MPGNFLKNNLEAVEEKISLAAEKSGRKKEDIDLIAVSKKKPVEDILSLYECGQKDFGENYVQEFEEKKNKITAGISWHFIGALQRNKVKDVVGSAELIHSVDRVELLKTVNEKAKEKNVIQKILLQVNIADEESKSGFDIENMALILEACEAKENVEVCGLMSFPPLSDDEKTARRYFSKSRALFELMQKKIPSQNSSFQILSMGTTSDYKWAIEEGATMVRVGTALFGERT